VSDTPRPGRDDAPGRRGSRRGPGDDRRGGGAARAGSAGAPAPQTRRSTPSTPGGTHGKPVGADRARKRDDAPPRRRSAAPPAPRRPQLPDEEPQLPKAVRKDLERTLGPGRKSQDVALALSVGSAAIDEGLVDVALEMLAWAKHEAPRVAAIREAYGVARYLDEDFAGALTELQAYNRITGRVDQNHLIADCHRALGRDVERIAAAAEPLLEDGRAPADRRAEAAIVLAAALADAGQVAEGRAVLRDALAERRDRDDDHHLRLRSLAADLALRAGDRDAAVRQLEVLAAAEPEGAYDAVERLAELGR
jgi:hypothetical protein